MAHASSLELDSYLSLAGRRYYHAIDRCSGVPNPRQRAIDLISISYRYHIDLHVLSGLVFSHAIAARDSIGRYNQRREFRMAYVIDWLSVIDARTATLANERTREATTATRHCSQQVDRPKLMVRLGCRGDGWCWWIERTTRCSSMMVMVLLKAAGQQATINPSR